MSLTVEIILFLYLSVIFVIAGMIYLRAKKEEGFYGHIFNWYISPLVIIAGLIFIDRGRKRQYFKRVKSNLFIK